MVDAPAIGAPLAARSATPSRFEEILEDGVLTGIAGAAVVALWFLILDAARGQMFFTPSLIGSVLFLDQPAEAVTDVNGLIVLAYTGLHGMLFLLAGTLIAWMFSQFDRNPQLGIVLLLLFLLFESVVFSLEAAVVPQLIGAMGTLAVASANLFAAVAMFLFLLRRHPTALGRLRQAWHED